MLRIGFDAKRAFLNHTGLGNYSRSVVTALAAHFPANQYFLYTTKAENNNRTAALFQPDNIHIRTPNIPLLKSVWRRRFMVSQLVKDKLDIYHGLSHEIPLGIEKTGIKTVVTIHDLIFLRYPQYYKAADRKIYEIKFRHACNYADLIVAVSEQTKKDIIQYFGTSPEKIKVVYQGCAPIFRHKCTPKHLGQIAEKHHLPDEYLLYVGTIEERKNLLLVAKAMKHLPSSTRLVVVGKQTAYADEVKTFLHQNNLNESVLFLENVPFSDLPAIYQKASVFIYPSVFEGFGIPILEALCSGIPVIAATGSCLEEAGGPDSVYIHPQDAEGLANAIDHIMNDLTKREAMIQAGLKYAAGFSDEIQANQLMQLYEHLIQ